MHHDLLRYAKWAQYRLTDAQADLLEQLTDAVTWAGRYPVHKRLDQSSARWAHVWDDELDALIEEFKAALDC
jgi:hypothetical protein